MESSSLDASLWAILPEKLPEARRLLSQAPRFLDDYPKEPSAAYYAPDGSLFRPGSGTPPASGLVAVIDIQGVLFARSEYYLDMQDYGNLVEAAAADERVRAVVLRIDSPGGVAIGVAGLAGIISEAARRKPVVAFSTGLCCSAALWIASSARAVYCSDATVRMGSIGVMASLADDSSYLDKLGIKIHALYSSLSPDKNRLENEALEGKHEPYIRSVLDPLAQAFIAHVKARRPGVAPEALTGNTYFAEEAVALGLADGLCSLKELIASLSAGTEPGLLVRASGNPATPLSFNQKPDTMNEFSRLSALLGCQLEMQDGGCFLNAEQLESVENALSSPAPAQTPAGQSPEAGAELAARLDALEARIRELEDQPAGQSSGSGSGSDFPVLDGINPWDYAAKSNQ